MWQRERLCDPQDFLWIAVGLFDENRLLSAIIADYAVTTCRNHEINQKKAYLLSNALILFIAAIIIFAITFGVVEIVDLFVSAPPKVRL
jgi:hypothetical protein